MKHILVVGSMNADLVIQTPRMPRMGETVRGSGFCVNTGGKGANQAAAIAKLGGDIKLLGCVGADSYGEMLLSDLSRFGVQTDGAQTVDTATGVAVITVCGGDNCIILDAGANACMTPEVIDANAALFAWADYCVLQLEIPLETVLHAARAAKKNGAKVVLNPAPMCPLPEELLALVDLFVPNSSEAEMFFGPSGRGHRGRKSGRGGNPRPRRTGCHHHVGGRRLRLLWRRQRPAARHCRHACGRHHGGRRHLCGRRACLPDGGKTHGGSHSLCDVRKCTLRQPERRDGVRPDAGRGRSVYGPQREITA